MMNRRGFLTSLLGAAAIPLIPVLGPISDAKKTTVGWKAKCTFDSGIFYCPNPPDIVLTYSNGEWVNIQVRKNVTYEQLKEVLSQAALAV